MIAPASPGSRSILIGARAERVVAYDLTERGYCIIGRNVRVGHLEIDVLARRSDLVLVVEVRCRSVSSWVGPLQSVTRAKRKRLQAASQALWLQRFEDDPGVNRLQIIVAAVEFSALDVPDIEYVPPLP